ncbi:3-deoxy-7-phosphoheptulonate synthase [Puniceicoccus vermicola]|uniref:Phospho-2-dehydro-3-deoxyheptonate aldolase n=1 Tax=Puniceicoccus vermicola TaxID=388746 RepID=A0A7X1E427_9BACT|nr:3-deoxy-7-phosphoheptulonate synthase [Puniceicoccus vermicola]MBC2601594.1 3-deoxy-7-phosphoheptulonate synthase [Puniceicoccus vermicola]
MQIHPHQTTDINVETFGPLPSPAGLCTEIPASDANEEFIRQSRENIHQIIFGNDSRHLAIVGPCSIHDTEAGLEYAEKLAGLAEEVKDQIHIVMRVYFEKPRTTVGWKGLIMDPRLDGSCNLPEGLRKARKFLLSVLSTGLPTATEFLDPITPQFIADLISWAAIGARTTESQTHRQMASGLSMPIGFKNTTAGAVQPAVNAIKAASERQTFLGIDPEGHACSVTTKGNPNCHVILRGGSSGENYSAEHVSAARAALEKASLPPAILVDCSHANSSKKPERQPDVFRNIIEQRLNGESAIIGSMIESNLKEGNQSFPRPLSDLERGVSITDGCIGWETTAETLRRAADRLSKLS